MDTNKLDDFLNKALTGDQAALNRVLLHYHDPLLAFIETLTGKANGEKFSAEDVLQETLVEAFTHIATMEGRGQAAFFAWLKTIARNRHLNMIEAKNAQKRGGNHQRVVYTAKADETAITLLRVLAGNDPTPSFIAVHEEALVKMKGAIAGLPEDKRKVLELRFGDDKPWEEVAREIQKSQPAAKMMLERTIDELRVLLKRDLGNPDSQL